MAEKDSPLETFNAPLRGLRSASIWLTAVQLPHSEISFHDCLELLVQVRMKEGQKTRRNIPRPFTGVQSARWCGTQQKLLVQNETREADAQTENTNNRNHTIPHKHTNNRSLMQSKDYKSFNRKVLGTVQTVGHQPVDEFHVPDYLITLERVTTEATNGLKTFALEYRPLTVWEDIKSGLDQLRNVWTKLKEAVNDLGLYVSMPGATQSLYNFPSIESATDEASIIEGQEICATVLRRIIQNTYDAFQPYFNNALRLIAVAFREKEVVVHPSSISGISIATRAIRLLGMLKEVENQLKSITDERYKFNLQGEYLTVRNLNMKEVLDEICRHLEKLQRNFFTSKYLDVNGESTLRTVKTMAEVMRRCWKECTLLVRYLRKISPEHKDTAYEKFSHVLCRAGSVIAEMQDSQDLQSYLTECEPIPYEDQIVENMVQAQLWLLPCLEDLIKFSSYLSKKMRSRVSPVSQMVLELKSVMYNVVMMATAGASWLISWMVRSSKPNLLALKEQGSQSLLLVYNYNKSDLSLRCSASSPKEDMPLYGAFVYTTNTLRNGVTQVHGMMRKEAEIEGTLSTTTTSLTITDSQETDYFQHHRVQGMEDLVPKFSLKGFPLDLETALESESFKFPPIKTTEETKEVTSTSTEDVQSTPTDLALEEGHPPPHQSDNNNQIEDPVSIDSYQLYTQFGTPVSEEQNTRGKGLDLQVLIPPLHNNNNDSPSLVTPFANYNPGSEVYTPTRNNGSFGPPSPDDIETSSSHVDMGEAPSGSSLGELESGKKVSMMELTGSEWIGRGAGGNVFKMSYVPRPVAVKIMNNDTRRTKDRFKKEVKIHSHLSNHPNIVQFVGTCSYSKDQTKGKSQNPMMVMELCDLGDLFKILCNARWVCEKRSLGQDISEYKTSRGYLLFSNWSLRLQVACDIAAGLEFMHSKGIVHRDLTSYNIVLTRGEGQLWIAKICDFERSREVPDCGVVPRSDTFANSPAWAAPEILDNRDYSTQADVYSFGVILWELATLQNPNEIEIDMFRREGAAFHQERRDILLHELSRNCDLSILEFEKFTSIIKQCLNEQGSRRPTMSEIHRSLVEIKHSITEERG